MNKETNRDRFKFGPQTKWDSFYRTTTAVDGLDPAVWRHDQFGNLIMADLTYCTGVLCYTFDHRVPVSVVKDDDSNAELAKLMSSIENCQALHYRTNLLKGSSNDEDIKSVSKYFGPAESVMKPFTENNHYVCKLLQQKLISQARLEELQAMYLVFLDSPAFLDPKVHGKTRAGYFEYLNALAKDVDNKVGAILGY